MNIKRLLLLVLFFFSIALLVPKVSKAVDLQEVLSSEDSIVVKIQEGIEYFFAFGVEKKVAVLEKHAEKRLIRAQDYAEEENNEKVQNLLQNYLQIKERQNNLLGKTNGKEVLGKVEERTIEQQKTMEEIKTKIDEGAKQEVVQVQEQVVNQVAKRVIDVNGSEGATEFLNKVEHVWAPGTGPGGKAGVVIVGGELMYASGTGSGGQGGVVIVGGEMRFAPGTSGGEPSGADIKTMEVKTGEGSDSGGGTTVEGGDPGTTSGGQNADPGTSSDGSKTWIDP
ncbi:hypothetical protein KKA69_03995 [Patescibacteria group bacterium]|nr:hypothetical protein [Patescibacteria group bacterium]